MRLWISKDPGGHFAVLWSGKVPPKQINGMYIAGFHEAVAAGCDPVDAPHFLGTFYLPELKAGECLRLYTEEDVQWEKPARSDPSKITLG